jgi:uncharacterized protein (DUF2141 family)
MLALPGAAPVGSLELGVDKLRSAKGVLMICLTSNAAKFPSCTGDVDAVFRNVPATTRAIRFDGLPTGAYGIAIIHDENGNRKLDTMLGIPREGFGFSRNPAIGFGAPRFAAARFAIEPGTAAQRVTMRYLL